MCLLAEHGAGKKLPELRNELASDCPHAASVAPVDVFFPQLGCRGASDPVH
jgi:hypothetical protein